MLNKELAKRLMDLYYTQGTTEYALDLSTNKDLVQFPPAFVEDDTIYIESEDIEAYELVFTKNMVDASYQLVDAFLAGEDIQDLDILGIPYEPIYQADIIVRNYQEYGFTIDSKILLARLLVKYEYSTINQDKLEYTMLDSWTTAPTVVTLDSFNKDEFLRYCHDTNSSWWSISRIKPQLIASAKDSIIEYISNNPESTDDTYFKHLLGAIVHNQFELSKHAENQLSSWIYAISI